MNPIFGPAFVAMFHRIPIRLGGNENVCPHRPESSPTPCAWRPKHGSETSKIRSIRRDANAILLAARVETPRHAVSHSIATSKSP